MVHLYFLTRGIKDNVDKFVNHMSCQYLPYKKKQVFPNLPNNTGYIQLAMRPIQLWECVVPEPSLNTVMKSIWNEGEEKPRNSFRMPLGAFRKTLGASPIPSIDRVDKQALPIFKENVCIYPIGIREDGRDENGDENL